MRSTPIVTFEKQYEKKMAQGTHQPIGKKQLFEIAKLKIRSNNPNLQFAHFLQKQIDTFENQDQQPEQKQQARKSTAAVIQMPRFIRANNRSTGSFIKLKGKSQQASSKAELQR